jgi:hypothetical protein
LCCGYAAFIAAQFDQQFEFGLDALLAGLDPGCNTLESR